MIRHKMFDWRLLKSYKFDKPVICIGNLSFGGSGKTPHTEYLVDLLSQKYRVAILSRGYKRKSKGFVRATKGMSFKDIGDEPMQYLKKFDNVQVAVDEKRVDGIKKLFSADPSLDVILLDDAFQHRQVRAGLNILLTDYYHLYTDDYLFPMGHLRDTTCAAKRADIIVVTKCPIPLSPIIRKELIRKIKPRKNQKIFFSYLHYKELIPLTEKAKAINKKDIRSIIMFSGISHPYPLKDFLNRRCSELISFQFKDHHSFTEHDFKTIIDEYKRNFRKKIIVTTEKDAMRFIDSPLFSMFSDTALFYIPIGISFHKEKISNFDEQVLKYVEENTRSC